MVSARRLGWRKGGRPSGTYETPGEGILWLTVLKARLVSSAQPAPFINEARYFLRTTLSAPSFAAFPNVSYAFTMSFIAKR
jgi:hypothetical protein